MDTPPPPYLISETGREPYVAWDEDIVITHALEYSGEHGSYSGMEEWGPKDMADWIRKELAANGQLDLNIPGPEGLSFTVRPYEQEQA